MAGQTALDGLFESDIHEIAKRLGDEVEEFCGRTLLLCGGMGFIGHYFTAVFLHLNTHVLRLPLKIVVLDNLITGSKVVTRPDSRHFVFVEHDITKPYDGTERPDFIIHAAGIASPYYYRKYPLETLDVATTGTKHMLELARKNDSRLLFFSSSEVYGDPDPRFIPTPEDYNGNVSCLGPRACYDEGKRLGETLCRVYYETFGTHVKIVRPFNVYGPGMAQMDYRALPNFANAIRNGRALNIYGSGRQTRTFCYVTDAIVGFVKALLRGCDGEPYNIGNTGPEISMIDLVKEIEAVLGAPVKLSYTRYPESYIAKEPLRRCPDLHKAQAHLGYEPRVDLREGLSRFFRWAEQAYVSETHG